MRGLLSALGFSASSAILRYLVRREPDFDRKFGTQTNEWVEVSDGDIPEDAFSTAVRYVPSKAEVIRHICRRLPIRHEEFTFIDVGSGRGKALMIASDFPFQRIIGVEISPQHHSIAEENIAVYRSPKQKCSNIESVCANALDYSFPKAPLVLYLYQPFGGPVLEGMLERVKEALEDQWPCFLCFAAPYHNQDIIQSFDYFEFLEKTHAFSEEDSWILYANPKAVALDREAPGK